MLFAVCEGVRLVLLEQMWGGGSIASAFSGAGNRTPWLLSYDSFIKPLVFQIPLFLTSVSVSD